ncbi:hypothetical protein UP10_12420 [Bradyrhizobium sp. LTSPM299]|uniref:hypothetical protein n=1 Tax=Bradyrhizobium sp. LTSPM299 TaxID=1619233 RepID=UPI0005CA632E|nr:hypothetical protein [Bradyrhizobium sp. LTSPM299]KJC60430.1 hypothetical protein UP10_12420 [Bradyrhizobium sp. LTSPM299]
MRYIASISALLLSTLAGPACAQSSSPVPAGEPMPDCHANVGYDRNQELPGYRVPDSKGGTVCVPFLPSLYRAPDGFDAGFHVDEFTDARLKARWAACKADAACLARLKPQLDRWVPPNKARSTRVTGTVDPMGRIDPEGDVDLHQIRRPAFFAREPYHEAIAGADPRTWIVEFTAPHDAFERLHLNMTGTIKLRGWYIEGAGVDDGTGGRTRALIVTSAGGGNQITAIQNLSDAPYTIDPTTQRIAENRFPNATTEGFGMARWRQILYRLNQAGFDVLAYDRRGEGLSGGFSDTNTLEQSADIFRALEQLRTGDGLRLHSPNGEVLAGEAAAGRLPGQQPVRNIPLLLAGYSRGSMTTGWAMQRNFVGACTYDLPEVNCAPPLGWTNIKGALMISSFGSGAGYVPDSPDLRDRDLFLGGMAAENNILFYPNSAVLAGMNHWPAAFFGKGLWDRAESLEGTIAAYRRIAGLKEIFVARGPHSIDTWTPSMLDRLADRMVAFGQAAIQGRSDVPGAAHWTTMRDLVASSPDDWEPSSRPAE